MITYWVNGRTALDNQIRRALPYRCDVFELMYSSEVTINVHSEIVTAIMRVVDVL